MAILIHILYQETAVSAVCRRIELVLYYIESMIYTHGLHQTVWSGETRHK